MSAEPIICTTDRPLKGGGCPDTAISKRGFDSEGLPIYQSDLDHRKGCGCGLCAAERPAGAVAMERES